MSPSLLMYKIIFWTFLTSFFTSHLAAYRLSYIAHSFLRLCCVVDFFHIRHFRLIGINRFHDVSSQSFHTISLLTLTLTFHNVTFICTNDVWEQRNNADERDNNNANVSDRLGVRSVLVPAAVTSSMTGCGVYRYGQVGKQRLKLGLVHWARYVVDSYITTAFKFTHPLLR